MEKSEKQKYVIQVKTPEEYEKLIRNGLVIVDYNTVWCGPCKRFAPIFEEMASQNPEIVFLSVDSEAIEHPDCESISSVPTFKVFFNREIKREFSGVDKARLERYINRYRYQIFINGKVKRSFNREEIEQINTYMKNLENKEKEEI